jgi:membrane-bound serine protease (ClpP class)
MNRLLGRMGWICLTLSLMVSSLYYPSSPVHSASSEPVYVIPVHQTIEQGLESFLGRAFEEAESAAAKAVILDIDTFGGSVSAAVGIGQLIQNSPIPVTAFIQGNAASAGAYIALNADQIVMTPGSSMGAAAVRNLQGKEVDPKITSYWSSKMAAAAELNGRNPEIAQAMVDPKVTIPGLKEDNDRPLTLTASEAKEVGYAEEIKSTMDEVLKFMGMAEQPIIYVKLSPSEQLARWITNPYIVPFLLIFGLGGIVFELLAPGFGFPGIIGLTSLGLFFFGHYVAGFAGIEHIFLFIAGIILMVIELFAPGFGIFGILGIGSLTVGIVLASYNTMYGLMSLGIAFLVSIGLAFIIVKYFGHRGTWNRLILRDELKTEQGYVSSHSKTELVGKKGSTVTPLRPSGTVMIDGERVDAVTEGGFILSQKEIVVVKVEGNRVVVREIQA